jgi:hypothetical protein
LKTYWLSGVLGNTSQSGSPTRATRSTSTPPREDLLMAAQAEAGQGLLKLDGEYAAATEALLAHAAEFRPVCRQRWPSPSLTFNEEMRAGHANM